MTKPDRIAAIREALEDAEKITRPNVHNGEHDPLWFSIKQSLAHLDALEKEREERRAAVRDLAAADDGITYEQAAKLLDLAVRKHAATIAGCKQPDPMLYNQDGSEKDPEAMRKREAARERRKQQGDGDAST